MTDQIFFCTLGKHDAPVSEMRKPPPSAPNRRQCNACASARQRAKYVRKPRHDWASRFLHRIQEQDGCWEWRGARAHNYGVTTIEGSQWLAHRVSYFLHYGDLPKAAFICHHCDNRGCVNPSHLYAGDVQTNSDDAVARGRLAAPRGEAQGGSKLTVASVRAMRSAHFAGASHSQLARQFGCSAANVYKVVKRITWNHV